MTKFSCACILALYLVAGWATMGPVIGVREEYASLTEVWRRGNVQAPMLAAGDRSGVLSHGGPKATAWLSAVEVADTIQDTPAGDADGIKGTPTVQIVPSPEPTRVPSDRSGRATWVHPSLHGNVQADGRVYSRYNPRYAASNDYPLGTVLELRHGERAIVVEVQDRGALPAGQFDLSEAGFRALAPLEVGVIEVTVREQ